MNYILTPAQIKTILEHWLNTPPNGYIGVNYGRNLSETLLKSLSIDSSDIILQWIKEDIPLFKYLTDDELKISYENVGIDKRNYFLQVGQVIVPLQKQTPTDPEGDTFYANAQ